MSRRGHAGLSLFLCWSVGFFSSLYPRTNNENLMDDNANVIDRLARIETVLTTQGRFIDKLADALINREVFNELQADVKEQEITIRDLQTRLKTLEVVNRIAGIVTGSVVGVIVTIFITRLMSLI